MPGPVFLRGDDVTLNPPGDEDVGFLERLVNHPDVWPSLAQYAPVTEHEEQEFVESLGDTDDVHLLICVDGDPVGILGLNHVDETWGVAELGYMVHPDAHGHGYATDACRRLVRYGFEARRLHKVTANAFETNPASQRVLEKVGFVEEGVFREHAYVGGEYVDVVRYGLLEPEY